MLKIKIYKENNCNIIRKWKGSKKEVEDKKRTKKKKKKNKKRKIKKKNLVM